MSYVEIRIVGGIDMPVFKYEALDSAREWR